jgi:putative transposase
MTVSNAKRLKALEDENAKPRKFLAEQTINMTAMKELLSRMVTQSHEPPLAQSQGDSVKREAVAHLQVHLGRSERWACEIAGAETARWCTTGRSARRTRCCGGGCSIWERSRFGYRRLFVLLRREREASGSTTSIPKKG